MHEYEFTLKFRLPQVDADPQQCIEALARAGCDDALVGVGQRGRIALDFAREASGAFDAIASAVRDVRKAIPGAALVEASPDFVGLTDVAEIAGCTRQNMRKLTMTHAATFPVAVHEGTTALWHLAPVLLWLEVHQGRDVDRVLLEVARINMMLNIAREARTLRGAALPRRLERLFD